MPAPSFRCRLRKTSFGSKKAVVFATGCKMMFNKGSEASAVHQWAKAFHHLVGACDWCQQPSPCAKDVGSYASKHPRIQHWGTKPSSMKPFDRHLG